MVTGVMGGREQAGNWRSPLTQIFHAQSELMVAAVERHRTAVLVYGDELLLKASYSYLHDLTLMKQNTSAGGSGMFPNEQACITLFDFLCCYVAFLQARPSAETGKDTKNIQLVWQGIRIYELYLTGYVKSIQQSASAVAEYPHAFDSTLQSERLGSQSTHHSSHKKSQSYLITLDLTLPHLRDVVSDLSH